MLTGVRRRLSPDAGGAEAERHAQGSDAGRAPALEALLEALTLIGVGGRIPRIGFASSDYRSACSAIEYDFKLPRKLGTGLAMTAFSRSEQTKSSEREKVSERAPL